ncbi:hypothetical protein ACIBF1_17900 [Spirillospora sp. NPDC050679]
MWVALAEPPIKVDQVGVNEPYQPSKSGDFCAESLITRRPNVFKINLALRHLSGVALTYTSLPGLPTNSPAA